ncbi:MAG: CRISPR system precrRNA processing endoribonuclease RAMP protein Cas6 [Actinomycetota bacterium]|nr:CRISPR system precrRNA processing endoribonuclease RAMP protein Cas6 [Actinomycetota bacterium]
MPSLWRCRLTSSVELDRSAVHRMLSRWLDTDHHAQRKPWSWTCAEDTSPRELLIGLLDDRLAERLRSGADAASMPVRQVAAAGWSELRSVLVGGFVGTVRYALDGDGVDPRVIDALVALAPFSGVGAYTTRGFGGVRRVGESPWA